MVSSTSVTNEPLKRKSDDVGWEYAVLADPKNLDRVECILCGKSMGGGIYRMKQHIAGIKGNVTACLKSTKEDQIRCRDAINKAKRKKVGKKQNDEDVRSHVKIDIDEEELTLRESVRSTSHSPIGHMDRIANQINSEKTWNLGKNMHEQNINEAICKERLDKVKEYACRFAYEENIPFAVFELDSCKKMFEAIGQYGVGCKPPTRYEMSETFLKKEVERTKAALKSQEEEWKLNGCSIITDDWSDRKGRSIMNLFVNSKLGITFISSKDFSNIPHTGQVIHDYVEKCITEVGPENVVQVVTDNTSNNMAAAKLLKLNRPQIFWTSCAAHSMNLMLESIEKLPKFKKCIDQAKALTIFIYGHHKTLAMMRAHTKKRDIVISGVTRFASSFLSLQSISEKRAQLKAMFTSNEWEECKFSKTAKGKIAYNTVLSTGFWNGISMCLQVFGPLVEVLRLVVGNKKPSMGFVYGELMKAKEEIKASLSNIAKNYQPIIDIIDAKMKDRLDGPLHLTAYLLNPFYHYRDPLLHLYQDVALGVIDCLDVLFHGNVEMQGKIMNEELPKYKDRESLFGKPLAVAWCMRENIEKFDPVIWWSYFGALTPNLQRLATRILSLTTSSLGCERNWSCIERIHTKKKNKLVAEQLNNLLYVNINAKIMNTQKKLKEKDMEVLLANEDASFAQKWIADWVGSVDDDVVEGDLGSDSSMTSSPRDEIEDGLRRSVRLRELDEDDLSSNDEEVEVDVDYESDNEDRVYGDEQPLFPQVPQQQGSSSSNQVS